MPRAPATPHGFSRLALPRPAGLASAAIARAILLGDIEVGARLPSEQVLASQLGVGRTVLRDALRHLAEDGILRTEPGAGGGTIVVRRPPLDSPHVLSAAVMAMPDMADVLITRRVLEPRIVEYAAGQATHEDLDALRAVLAPLADLDLDTQPVSDDVAEALSLAAVRFNATLGRASHSPPLAQLMEMLTGWTEPIRRIAVRRAPRAAAATMFGTLEAIEKNDHAMIKAAMEDRFAYLEQVWEAQSGRRLWRGAPPFLALGREPAAG